MSITTTLGGYAISILKSGKGFWKKGQRYVTRGTKNILSKHTKIGRRLKEGVHYAREAYQTQFNKIAKESSVTETISHYTENLTEAAKTLVRDNDFIFKLEDYALRRGVQNYSAAGKTQAQILQDWIEMSGIGPTKLAQILSDNPKEMEKLIKKYPNLVKALNGTRKNCAFTRTVEEAQAVIDKAFPGKGFKIQKECRAASIGATYFVEKPDGTEAIVKMIKKGVTKETIELEEELTMKILKEVTSSPEEYSKLRELFRSYYKDWREEVNFISELKNNQMLANGAKRYSVARITNISEDGKCILMEKAKGIQMDDLMEILKDYKANPQEFATKYAKQISENPWLADPEKVMRDLPDTILKTFDEQFLFVKKGGASLMHGDPHKGNFFITTDKSGRLMPQFIDTGNCVARTSTQIKEDISFFSNYLVGNSEGVAKYFIEQCGYNGADKAEKIAELAANIEKHVFGKKQKITQFTDIQGTIMSLLEKQGLSLSAENATALKAQMQFFQNISEAGKLSGQSFNVTTIMKDIPQAAWGMIKHGENPYSSIKEALKFALHNQRRAVGTAYQFTMKDIEQLAKEGKELLITA